MINDLVGLHLSASSIFLEANYASLNANIPETLRKFSVSICIFIDFLYNQQILILCYIIRSVLLAPPTPPPPINPWLTSGQKKGGGKKEENLLVEIDVIQLLLQAALSTLLLILYNCSDQVLTARERRLAKSREAAARSARETAKARQRWRSAKDAAKKHVSGLQAHLSHTFSRKKDAKDPEKLKILDRVISDIDDDPLPPPHPSMSATHLPSRENKKEPSELMQIMHEIEDNPDNYQDISIGTGDMSSHINVPKGKQTHTQIFKYAYAQLEKERAQQQENEKLTFSGIVNLATHPETRKRPLIEISFKDLTLTLKAKNKHLLRCVTGKIKPGRITAVMGPSGAGKTTFLSAVAGKAIGCRMTGLIHINGSNDSIHSYKKIIGFVPQDDIVHGNLTVEENLWFSAKCRYAPFAPCKFLLLILYTPYIVTIIFT